METTHTANPNGSAEGKNMHGVKHFVDRIAALKDTSIGRSSLQATSLSFYSILGLVPFLALCFAIAKSFGLEQALSTALNEFFTSFNGQEEVLAQVRGFADNLISNYSGSVMAFSAIGLIFWSGFRILQLLESTVGSIFGYRPPRRIMHRALDYFAAMVILPMVIILTAAINIYLTGLSSESWSIPFGINPNGIVAVVVVITPYLMWWLVLTSTYMYFSRGLAKRSVCLLGGLVTSLVFQLFQSLYIGVMIALTSYSAIYGSFAAVPLFMIWLNGAWLIILAGGELTRRFADSAGGKIPFFSVVPPPTWRETVELGQSVMEEVVRNFTAEPSGSATSFHELSKATGAPMQRLGVVITRLMAVGLLVRVNHADGSNVPVFLPSRCPEQITGQVVRDRLEAGTLGYEIS